jgi:hypothetical protein
LHSNDSVLIWGSFTNRHGLPIPAVQALLDILCRHIDELIESG